MPETIFKKKNIGVVFVFSLAHVIPDIIEDEGSCAAHHQKGYGDG